MSNYIFAPSPTFSISEHPFVTYNEAFTLPEIDMIVKHLDTLPTEKAFVGNNNNESRDIADLRTSKVAWVALDNRTQWIYDRLAYVCRILNGQFYRFDLYGFSEDFQYTIYEGENNSHYTWHMDRGISPSQACPRKFSLVLQLNDPEEYDGGDLEIMSSPESDRVDRKKGLIAAFPSFTLHRVTPVTRGIRKTLVVWVCGPSFR